MKKNSAKRSLLVSLLALCLCFVMLIGATFAWFTDSTANTGNIIASGTLDVKMSYSSDNVTYTDVEADDAQPIFNYDKWEPGYTDMKYIKIENIGTLAFMWQLYIVPNGTVGNIADVIDVYVAEVDQSFDYKTATYTNVGTLAEMIAEDDGAAHGAILAPGSTATPDAYERKESVTLCIAFHMREDAGNEYQNSSIGTDFSIQLIAKQYTEEVDSFNDQFDKDSTYPALSIVKIPANTVAPTEISMDNIVLTVPANVDAGTYQLELANKSITTDSNDKTTFAFDLSLTKDGDVVSGTTEYLVEINIGKNLVFGGVTHNGEAVDNATYDPFTGIVTFTVNSFSPFTVNYSNVSGEAPIFLPEGVTEADFGNNVAYVNGAYYSTLKSALLSLHSNSVEENVIYLKPGADLGAVNHAHVCSNLTVYGNGAYVSGGGDRDFEIGFPAAGGNSCPNGITDELTLNVYNLNGCAVWGSINSAHEHNVNVNLFNCKDVSKVVLLKSGSGAPAYDLNITIDNCTFTATDAYKDSAIYCQNLVELNVSNTTFTDYAVGINLNNKDGVENYTFTNCKFIDCSTATNIATNKITDATSYAAPIRAVASAAGTVTNLVINNCEFLYTSNETAINGDILTYQNGHAGTVNLTIDGIAQ